jgi:hypothetical protein
VPDSIHVCRIGPGELTPYELRQIRVTLELSYDKVEASKVLALAATGDAQIWRISGDATGVVVTQVLDKGVFHELFVWVMAGEKILPNLHRLLVLLDKLAEAYGCHYVHAMAKPRLAAVYVGRHGFQTDAVSVYREVKDGRVA